MRACRKYWFTDVSSLVSTVFSSLMISRSPCMSRLLFGGDAQALFRRLNHAPHVTDAFGALGGALAMAEHVCGLLRAGLDGLVNVAFADAVAVADVHAVRFPARRKGLRCEAFLSSPLRMPLQLIRKEILGPATFWPRLKKYFP